MRCACWPLFDAKVGKMSGQTGASDYTLIMAPATGPAMASDDCGSFTITAAGVVKGATTTLPRGGCCK